MVNLDPQLLHDAFTFPTNNLSNFNSREPSHLHLKDYRENIRSKGICLFDHLWIYDEIVERLLRKLIHLIFDAAESNIFRYRIIK